MREVSILLPGGFPVIISVWITGVVLYRALASVSVGSWASVWIPLSGVIVTQVRAVSHLQQALPFILWSLKTVVRMFVSSYNYLITKKGFYEFLCFCFTQSTLLVNTFG